MLWVRAQMEHAKSHARASSIAPKSRKEAEDVDMGNMEEAGDWTSMEQLANALYAFTKGKGKGKGGGAKGKGSAGKGYQKGWPATEQGKGNAKGGKPGNLAGGDGKAAGKFDGTCHHCGKYGHRKVECRALDAEMAKSRATPLNNVDEPEESSSEENAGAQAAGEEEDVWWMGATYSLTAERPCRPTSTSNRFEAFKQEECGPTPNESLVRPHAAAARRAPEPWIKRKYVRFNQAVNLLVDDGEVGKSDGEDPTLNALGVKTPGAVLIEAVVDSGAADPVARAGTFGGKVMPSTMSKAGRKYRGPDGTRIPNEGQQQVQFTSDEGHRCGMTWQIADVERPLIAVSHLSAAGNNVIFTKTGGEIVNNATGKKIKIQKKGGVYVLRMWVPGPQGTSPSKPFARPASTK
jgi:hypothetical protein